MRFITATFLALIFTTYSQIAQSSPPLDSYAELPIRGLPRLSPDGQSVVAIESVNGLYTFVIHHLDGRPPTIIPTSLMEPKWIEWKSDNRLIFSLSYFSDSDRFREDKMGRVVVGRTDLVETQTRLFGIDADLNNMTDLFAPNRTEGTLHAPSAMAPGSSKFVDNIQDNVASFLPNDPDHILLLARLDAQRGRQLLKINVHTGIFEPGDMWGGNLIGGLVDSQGISRLKVVVDGAQAVMFTRASATDDWHPIREQSGLLSEEFVPVAFSAQNPNILYVTYKGSKAEQGLYEYNLIEGSLGARLSPSGTYILHNGLVVGYTSIVDDVRMSTYIDQDWNKDAAIISKALPDKTIHIIDRTEGGKQVLVLAEQNNLPRSYFLLDRSKGKPTLGIVFGDYSGIDDDQVAPVKIVRYKARDGLTIPAFLTLPLGYKSGPIPFVILPHDGPGGHNSLYEFEALPQLIASRGYGVLQPQYRGSTGFGSAFQNAGKQQWGLSIQDDITDGTKWLIDQVYADIAKICIVGRGYGGYATLMGLVKEPALYKCGAAFSPISNLNALKNTIHQYEFGEFRGSNLGENGEILRETSPNFNADKILASVLLVHGRKDSVIPVSQTKTMVDALQDAKKTVKVIYLDEADHALTRREDRRAWQSALINFLRENLGHP